MLATGACLTASAELISGVTATAATQYDGFTTGTRLVDNSGLSAPDDVTATHDDTWTKMWLSNGSAPADQYVDFNLGDTYDLNMIYIWQYNQNGTPTRGVKQFDLLVSYDNGANYTEVSSDLTLAQSPGTGVIAAQSFAFSQEGVTDVRINVDSSWGDTYVGLAEVKFDAIPEPATMGLIAVASGGILFIRRRFMI